MVSCQLISVSRPSLASGKMHAELNAILQHHWLLIINALASCNPPVPVVHIQHHLIDLGCTIFSLFVTPLLQD